MSFTGAKTKRGYGLKVKICGVADLASLAELVNLGIDAVGFVFYDASPRAVVVSQVREWMEEMPPFVHTVGVFVDEKAPHVKKVLDLCGLDFIQLHGQETPEYCAELPKKRVIKAFRIKNGFGPDKVLPYIPHVSGVLLDSPLSGEICDWGMACRIREAFPELPVILAGGITPDNVEDAVRHVQPYAIDVSSGVEISPGVKSAAKIQDLLHRIASLPSPVH